MVTFFEKYFMCAPSIPDMLSFSSLPSVNMWTTKDIYERKGLY